MATSIHRLMQRGVRINGSMLYFQHIVKKFGLTSQKLEVKVMYLVENFAKVLVICPLYSIVLVLAFPAVYMWQQIVSILPF